ncbi:MAG: CoA transferase [Gammaproteobacteria bacterium]|nr:CoA transferase [Gammaproteobacteria bacterium]
MTPATSLDTLPLALSANLALARFRQVAQIKDEQLTGANLLYERAFMLGLVPTPTFSPNGSCHLLPCRDALLAVNLPRSSDWELLPAWLGPWRDNLTIAPGDWPALEHQCRELAAGDLLQQAHSLGLAVAVADELPPPPSQPIQIQCFHHRSRTTSQRRKDIPLVVDLSSLWAGPLCGYLLQKAGCRVIKVEGLNRLDGARTGFPDFYQLLNQGKESVALDFKSAADIERLKQLIAHADIVIEASRPRALHNIGIHAEHWVQSQPGRVWLSITGYGRHGADGARVGFGDDTATAAGLSRIMFEATGDYQIVGDAIADPLTGIHAALSAWQSYLAGGNELISISLRDTVSFCLHNELNLAREHALESCRRWRRLGNQLDQLFPTGPRIPATDCAAPGQHNASVFAELDLFAGAFHQQHHP